MESGRFMIWNQGSHHQFMVYISLHGIYYYILEMDKEAWRQISFTNSHCGVCPCNNFAATNYVAIKAEKTTQVSQTLHLYNYNGCLENKHHQSNYNHACNGLTNKMLDFAAWFMET